MAKSLRDKRINQIMYISLGGVIVAILLFIVLFNIFSVKSSREQNNLQIGESRSSEEMIAEETNLSIGKKVDEAKEYEEIDEGQAVQVADETVIEGQLGEELSNQSDLLDDEENMQIARSTKLENSEDVANTTNEMNSANDIDDEDEEKEENEEEVKDPTFSMPVEGEIVKQYGKEKLIYSDTLKEWTTHLGIDIKADKTTVVKASADGVVKSIKNDPRYGLTVVIEHQNGFTSVYSNLLTAEFVVVGENIKSGQTLGTVGNSATFEILDDPHLHFEILKDGKSVDPEMYVR